MSQYTNYSNILSEAVLALPPNSVEYLQELLETFNLIFPFLLFFLTLFGIYIYYTKKKHTISYKLEDTHKIDSSTQSTNNLIENYNSIFHLLKSFIKTPLTWIISIVLLVLTYAIAGFAGMKVLIAVGISVHIAFFFKLFSRFYKIQIEEGKKNLGYISLNTLLLSLTKLFVYALSKANKVFKLSHFPSVKSTLDRLHAKSTTIRRIAYPFIVGVHVLFYAFLLITVIIRYSIHLLIYAFVPVFLVITSFKIFVVYEFLLFFYHIAKCIPLYQVVRSMMNAPKFINIDMIDGGTVENLILYQTTLSDYRAKGYNTRKEYIIPSHNVKFITEDYTFKLNELNNVIDENYLLPLEDVDLGYNESVIRFFLSFVKKGTIHKVLYEKAKFHLKMNEFNLCKEALEETLKCVIRNKKLYSPFMSLLKTDSDLDNVRNEEWFIQLLTEPIDNKL